MGFDPAPFLCCSDARREEKVAHRRLPQVAEGYVPWRAVLTPSGQTGVPPWRTGRGSPGRAHMERPRRRIATGIKKFAAFPAGALTDFGFQETGVGWVRAPARACASARSRAVAQRQEEAAIVFLHLSSFAMRWTAVSPTAGRPARCAHRKTVRLTHIHLA